jgi:hypothetical protein
LTEKCTLIVRWCHRCSLELALLQTVVRNENEVAATMASNIIAQSKTQIAVLGNLYPLFG